MGRSHRSALGKDLSKPLMKQRNILKIPSDYLVEDSAGFNTGAFECAVMIKLWAPSEYRFWFGEFFEELGDGR